jgi:hypothetical protein
LLSLAMNREDPHDRHSERNPNQRVASQKPSPFVSSLYRLARAIHVTEDTQA